MKEKIQEPAEYHGVTTRSAIPAEEFEKRVAGEAVADVCWYLSCVAPGHNDVCYMPVNCSRIRFQ